MAPKFPAATSSEHLLAIVSGFKQSNRCNLLHIQFSPGTVREEYCAFKDRETREPHGALMAAALRRTSELGLALNGTRSRGANVMRLTPPLTITREQIDSGLAILDQALGECA